MDQNTNKQKNLKNEIKFYIKSSLPLLIFIIILELITLFALSKTVYIYEYIIPWIFRTVIFSYLFYKIRSNFSRLNLVMFGAILGLETGFIISIVKIIFTENLNQALLNLITDPIYLMGLASLLAIVFRQKQKK